jgi:hypothetical protein
MALFGDKWKCTRCGKKNEPLGYAPVPNELGTRIGEEICKTAGKSGSKSRCSLSTTLAWTSPIPILTNFSSII